MSALRELLVSFGFEVDTAELKKGEEHSNKLLHHFEALGKSIAEVFVAHEIKEFFESTIEGARELARSAVIFGMPAEKLQELEHAANMADVSAETLHMGLMRLQRSMSAAGEGGGELGKVFKELGIDLKSDGKTKDTADILSEIADQVKKVEDPAKRTAIAMKIFGRGGAQLAPLLAKGSEGIAELREEVQKLGGGYSEELLEKSEEVEDATKRLNFEMKSLRGSIVTGMIPAAMALLDGLRWVVGRFTALNKEVSIAKLAMAGLFGFILMKLPAVTAMITRFAIGSGLAVAKWLLLWAVLDDIIGLFTGADSEIGAILDSVFGEGAAEKFVADVKAMTSSWEGFKDGIAAFIGAGGSGIIAWLDDQTTRFGALVKYISQFINLFGRVQAFMSGQSQESYNKQIAAERDSTYAQADEQWANSGRVISDKYRADFDAIREAAAERKIIADREAQLSQSLPVAYATVAAGSGEAAHIDDHSVINVTTLPATSATQAREVGRAVAKARSQQGDNRATLAATEHRVEK